MARRIIYITCPVCGEKFQSLGYASHRAKHTRERDRMKKSNDPANPQGNDH